MSNRALLHGLMADQLFNTTPSVEAHEGVIEEKEYVFYLLLTDFEQLARAERAEHQEQWSVLLKQASTGVEGSLRIRSANGEVFTLTSKYYFPGAIGKWEIEKQVGEAQYEQLKRFATEGMKKDRYVFPIPGTDLEWELDVHVDQNGNRIDWVRLELEVPEALETIPPFPVEFTESILRQKSQQTDEERRFVRKLYEERYVIRSTSSTEDLDDQGIQKTPSGDAEVAEKNEEDPLTDDEKVNGGVGDTVHDPEVVRQGETEKDEDSATDDADPEKPDDADDKEDDDNDGEVDDDDDDDK